MADQATMRRQSRHEGTGMPQRRGGWSWGPVEGAKLRCLSVGAGVQSTTLALMAARGVVGPLPDAMIFADTQAESAATMDHLHWLESEVARLTNGRMATHRVSAGSITETIERRSRNDLPKRRDGEPGRFVSAPFFTGNGGMGRRQCTREFKVEPLTKKQRELLGYRPRQRIPVGSCEVWIGISTDEVVRAGSAYDRWVVNYGGFAAFLVRRRFACLSSRHDGLLHRASHRTGHADHASGSLDWSIKVPAQAGQIPAGC